MTRQDRRGRPGPWRALARRTRPCKPESPMDAVILCGGRGTRLQEHTRGLPKPLVEVGGRPIVWHVVRLLAAQGVRRFLLATGYKGEQVAAFAASVPWGDG